MSAYGRAPRRREYSRNDLRSLFIQTRGVLKKR